MPVNDPVADMLTRIRNGIHARHESVLVPHSKLKAAVATILKEQGYIRDYDMPRGHQFPTMRVHLAYRTGREPVISGLKRVSKPGLRVYVGKGEIPRVYGGLGLAILSTSRGVYGGPPGLATRHWRRTTLLCLVTHWKESKLRAGPFQESVGSPYPFLRELRLKSVTGGVTVKGPRGTLTQNYHPEVKVTVEDGQVLVERLSERKFHHSLHGLTRSLIANAIVGVTDGYTKTLELMGVGYRVQQSGEGIVLNVGFSHPVEIQPREGVTMEVEGINRVHVRGIDKQKVGELAAQVRKVRPPNAYKEKGIRYQGEILHFKPGKAAARKA